jgi:hypothetical protein
MITARLRQPRSPLVDRRMSHVRAGILVSSMAAPMWRNGGRAWQILGVNAVSLIIMPAARMLMRHETGGRQ